MESRMKFLCLGYFEPAKMKGYSAADEEALLAQCRPHLRELYASGHLVVDAGLADERKSMRLENGKGRVIDGPFTETKEVVGAAFIVEAPDMDAAIEIAKLHPTTRVPIGEELCWTLEIRPIHHFREGDR